MMYSGIDLHSNNRVIAVIDDGDRVVAQKGLPNETADRPHRKPSGDWRQHAGSHGSVKFF
jgi:hypothetical protein